VRRAAEHDRPDGKQQRDDGQAAPPALDPAQLGVGGETWGSTTMSRGYGRAPAGERLVGAGPHGHGATPTFVAGRRGGGMPAPLVIAGAMSGERFVAYVGQVLVPTLRPGDGGGMDNRSSHKRVRVRGAIAGAGGTLLYLPPYRPDVDPIEQAFAKLKALLRKAGGRTVEGWWSFLGRVLAAFAPEECRNYFRHCGYRDPTLH
jgi:transposase